MSLEIKYVTDPETWGKVVGAAEKEENTNPFPMPILDYSEIATRWSEDHHVVIGMRSEHDKATTGFVQLNKRFVDRVFNVPWD